MKTMTLDECRARLVQVDADAELIGSLLASGGTLYYYDSAETDYDRKYKEIGTVSDRLRPVLGDELAKLGKNKKALEDAIGLLEVQARTLAVDVDVQ